MKATIYQMRLDGAKLPDREWQAAPVGPGRITLGYMSGRSELCAVRVLEFRSPQTTGGLSDSLLPPLFEPELLLITNTRLRFRGFQTVEGSRRAVVQEWLCELGEDGEIRINV
ncbi:hypothetical protein [Amantichitinum ursilacus]|uniref:Uncharacterized protein n=1 Tax=Amantichitinum ursilacus TaxID=857265 RepID=A0A0N0GNP6_9NEIS|nr:hypothetical protein [Amantichitinum ursilacus]KPC53044.1 hypothetical protein WG78_11155 [Amantichitinum ursilacus]